MLGLAASSEFSFIFPWLRSIEDPFSSGLFYFAESRGLSKIGPGLNGIAQSMFRAFQFSMAVDDLIFFVALLAALGILVLIARRLDSSLRKERHLRPPRAVP
jgi:hypothetical protein